MLLVIHDMVGDGGSALRKVVASVLEEQSPSLIDVLWSMVDG